VVSINRQNRSIKLSYLFHCNYSALTCQHVETSMHGGKKLQSVSWTSTICIIVESLRDAVRLISASSPDRVLLPDSAESDRLRLTLAFN
jgi:hypothetical protein